MRGMELKVWVDGVQRIVCGVTEVTTCQEVVIALAQAIGRTGRYTLIERWRETERPLAPHESPVVSLNKWGQYAGDVQLVLQRTGPSLGERPTSDSSAPLPERGLYRQSLPPLAKLRPHANEHSLCRREPKRKSLTFTGGARGLRHIFSKNREADTTQRAANQNAAASAVLQDLRRLVQRQEEELRSLETETRLLCQEEELQGGMGQQGAELEEELVHLEQQVRRNEAELEEEGLWEQELRAQQERERGLRERLQELHGRMQECNDRLAHYLTRMQEVEARLQAELQLDEQKVLAQAEQVSAELEVQMQQAAHLESSCRTVERSVDLCSQKLQEREQELELLTKELRQVNLQQFIQQTGTKVTVLPAEPDVEQQSGSLRGVASARQLPNDLRILQSPLTSRLNPDGIYV